jgi:hypothetical protein
MRRAWSFAVLLGGALAALSGRASAHEPAAKQKVPAPAPRHDTSLSRARSGGIFLFGVSYGLVLAVPVMKGFRDGREWLAVPLAGPWVAMTKDAAPPWALVLDDLGQLFGTALILAGPSITWRDSIATLQPWTTVTSSGISASGSF